MMRKILILSFLCFPIIGCFAQLQVPTDYLSKEFHKGRRDALRQLMPANSVFVVFASPMRNFANDVDYKYHANPDLYYFSGYTEPSAVLLIFKEYQNAADSSSYNEIIFVQKKDPKGEQWTGKRLGIEGTKEKLGFSNVYNATEFAEHPLDLMKFDQYIFEFPQEISDKIAQSDDTYDLIEAFKKKAGMPADYDADVMADLSVIKQYASMLTSDNLPKLTAYYKERVTVNERYKKNALASRFIALKDSADAASWLKDLESSKWNFGLYTEYTNQLRQIKTPEELVLMRKAIDISALAHNEAMKAVKPEMSELELQGVQEFIHKKLGAEYVGYPSIAGAGNNGCVLHYIENNVTNVGNRMVLMDIGAEYHGYTADVTRTLPANGKFTAEQKQIYDIVYEAQEAVFKICKEGTSFDDVEKTAREVVATGLMKLGIIKEKKENRTYYPHGCSHFLGLDVHDKGEYNKLKENMIITVEPGIYIPEGSDCDKKWWGIAVRIEDDVLIGKDKMENLSILSPRKAEDVEKMVSQKSFVDGIKLEMRK
jgi:Xaa-Pro aminopeptidase